MKTGIQFFDNHTGGLEKNTITLVYGSFGVGKTNFCLIALTNFLKENENKRAIFIDTDSSFSVERVKQILNFDDELIKNVLERVIIYRPADFREQRKITLNLPKFIEEMKDVGLVVVDSLTMLYRLEFNKENNEVSLIVAKLLEIARKKEIPVLMTSQTYVDFDNKNLKVVGGEIVLYASKTLIHLEKNPRKLSIVKSRHVPEKQFKFKITNRGFDLE